MQLVFKTLVYQAELDKIVNPLASDGEAIYPTDVAACVFRIRNLVSLRLDLNGYRSDLSPNRRCNFDAKVAHPQCINMCSE